LDYDIVEVLRGISQSLGCNASTFQLFKPLSPITDCRQPPLEKNWLFAIGSGEMFRKRHGMVSRKGRNDRKEGFHVAELFKNRFSRACIKTELFLFSVSSGATL
jgi:hypothetical protein